MSPRRAASETTGVELATTNAHTARSSSTAGRSRRARRIQKSVRRIRPVVAASSRSSDVMR